MVGSDMIFHLSDRIRSVQAGDIANLNTVQISDHKNKQVCREFQINSC